MDQNIGTWKVKIGIADNVHAYRAGLTDQQGRPWGTFMGLGYTPYLEIRLRDDTTLIATMSGTWEDAGVQSAALFLLASDPTLFPTSPSSSIDYDAIILMDNGSNPTRFGVGGSSVPIQFRIETWP